MSSSQTYCELIFNSSFHNLLTYGHTKQHTIFTHQTNNTQFIDAPDDGPVGPKHVEQSNNLLTYGHTKQHTIFTYQTSNTQFIDAPEDGPVGPKHVEQSNILWINIQQFLPQPPNVWTHRATHNLHIPNQQHTVYRRSWGCTCRPETCRAVKHIVNRYSTVPSTTS
jgi:hypothetical protein